MNFGQVRIMEEVSLAIAAIIAIVFGILLETGLSASMIPNKKWWKIINVSAIFVCIASLLLSIGSLIYEIGMQSVYNKRRLVPLDDSGIDPSNGNCPTTVIYIEKENLKIVL
jgi:hypothetical protein